MGNQVVSRGFKKDESTLNFAASNDILFFTAANADEIYQIDSISNISTISIFNGTTETTLYSSGVFSNLSYSLTKGIAYRVTITRPVSSLSSCIMRTRYRANTASSVSNIDLDVTITNNYIITATKAILLPKAKITTANYAGAGVWTAPLPTEITLPNTGLANFSWLSGIHVKLSGIDYVAVFGWQSTNTAEIRVCIINTATLVVSNLSLVANTHSIITANTTSIFAYQTHTNFVMQENPLSGRILLSMTVAWEIDLVTLKYYYLGNYPSTNAMLPSFRRKGFYNITDNLYTSYYGCFSTSKAPVLLPGNPFYASDYCYDYSRNTKFANSTYPYRIRGFNSNGLINVSITNPDAVYPGTATHMIVKKNCLVMFDTTYIYILNLNTGGYLRQAIADKTLTSLLDRSYCNEDGRVFMLTGNTTRVHFFFIGFTSTPTCTQAYVDLSAQPITDCNDKTNISA